MSVTKHVLPGDPNHLKNAFEYVGTTEIRGSKHNPKVVQMFADVGHSWVKNDETAWCAAFVGSMLKKAELPHTGSLAARSYLQWGKKTTNPKRGDVVVFKRGNSSWQGHVAFYLGKVGSRIWVLGGNQSNKVSVTSYPESSLLGYRTPITVTNSRTVAGMAVAGLGASTAGVGELGEQFKEAGQVIQGLSAVSPWLMVAGGVLILGGIAWIGWARYNDWKEKAR